MLWNRHPADHKLLLTSDGGPQLSGTRAVQHVAGCSHCQHRRDDLTRAVDELLNATRHQELLELPPSGPARARLQTRLADLSTAPAPAAFLTFTGQARWLHAVALLLVLAGAFLVRNGAVNDAPRVFLLPIPELTPGSMRAVSVTELCGERLDRLQPIPASLHERVFQSYGADPRRAADYELDYLITPELGGSADARNLWPQAYAHTPWNAFVKDELERSLHRDLCAGRIDLTAAQQQMAGDWIAAYKQYFKTDEPLRDYNANPLTAVDHDLLLSELEELGAAPAVHADGNGLLAMFHAARTGYVSNRPLQRLAWSR